MKYQALLKKMNKQREKEPYKWLCAAFEWLDQDADHCGKSLQLLEDEIKLLEIATNKSDNLLQFWSMPQMLWYCGSYMNATRQHRLNCITLIQTAHDDANLKLNDPQLDEAQRAKMLSGVKDFQEGCISILSLNQRIIDEFTKQLKRGFKVEKLFIRGAKPVEEKLERPTQKPAIQANREFLRQDCPF